MAALVASNRLLACLAFAAEIGVVASVLLRKEHEANEAPQHSILERVLDPHAAALAEGRARHVHATAPPDQDAIDEELPREAMRFTFSKYRELAWGDDNIDPKTGAKQDSVYMALTMCDSLSTLWLMDLKDEFYAARDFLAANALPLHGEHLRWKVFELTIRVLAGLTSAFFLSGDKVFLNAAQRFGNTLLKSWGKGLLPPVDVWVDTGDPGDNNDRNLAEVGSLQLEFRALSQATGDRRFDDAAFRSFTAILDATESQPLLGSMIEVDDDGKVAVSGYAGFGGGWDSFYEYLIKLWIQGGKKDDRLKNKWIQSMKEMERTSVFQTADGLTYVSGTAEGRQMQHLACFVPGMLMLGVQHLPKEDVEKSWVPLAENLTYTCYQMYERSPTGLAAESYDFRDGSMQISDSSNILRPEAAESIYYMHYYTGDGKYRTWARNIMLAFNKHSRDKFGYASRSSVNYPGDYKKQDQPSFWLAETLKYLFLTLSKEQKIDLNKWVFNTEAHPLPIMPMNEVKTPFLVPSGGASVPL